MKSGPLDTAALPIRPCRVAMLAAICLPFAACAHALTAEPPAVEAAQQDSPAISPWAEPPPDVSIQEDPAYTQDPPDP